MKKIFIFLLFLTLIAGVFLLSSCFSTAPSQSSSTGGSGSEVVGVVNYPDSSSGSSGALKRKLFTLPLANCNVFIHPASFLAEYGSEDTPETMTENDGFFRISNVRPGTHYVYIKDAHGNGVLREINVPVDSVRIDLGLLLVQQTAGARIQYNDGAASDDVLFYVSVRGTGLTVSCTGKGIYAGITGIPVDTEVDYMFTVRMKKPFDAGYDIRNIRLLPGITVTLDDITDNLLNH